jgi:hypothetical protein
MAAVPLALTGGLPSEEGAPPLWRNRALWLGFGIMLLWCLLRGWHGYDADAPNLQFRFSLKTYLTDPGWGKTWDEVQFTTNGLLFSLGLFMELNVLMSLVLGYLMFRLQHWFGEAQGLSVDTRFPYGAEQMNGAFVAYGLLILVFARKHLGHVFRRAVRGLRDADEVLSSRATLLLLAACVAGVALWALWAQLPLKGMLVFFLFMLLFALVATRFRAECGTPDPRFLTGTATGFLFLGGFTWFAPPAAIFIGFFSGMFVATCFWVVPGLQFELLELGRRYRLRRTHLIGAALLGFLGGILIGGWIYFSGAHAIGADNYPIMGHFGNMRGALTTYNLVHIEATEAMSREPGGEAGAAGKAGLRPEAWAFLFGAAGALATSVLRQLFAGFWFHPMGLIVGPSQMMHHAWSSLLLAWLVRFAVLKLGGAATVRNRLIPFAIGCVVALLAAAALFGFIQAYLYFFNPGIERSSAAF